MPRFNQFSKSSGKIFVAAAIALSLASVGAHAGKPKGAKKVAPKTIIGLYAGNTNEWTSGWPYWAPDGKLACIGRTTTRPMVPIQ